MRTIAVTLGDPAGVGPEVVARALKETRFPGTRFVVIGPWDALFKAAERTGTRLSARRVERIGQDDDPTIQVINTGEPAAGGFGSPDAGSGRSAFQAVERAVDLALDRKVDAIVTAPVSKRWISESGTWFTGHTEYLAGRAGAKHPVMLFVAEKLRVSLVTIHVPLRKVPLVATFDRIVATVRETERGLKRFFGVMEPKIAVAGLNPHAGEGGQFGREEIDVIGPAVEALRKEGLRAKGPLPADTLFRRAMGGEFDAVVAMYHDQALGPIKTVADDAVNVTLGLPFIRTSVDHGTAFDIAGQGKAEWAPMVKALTVAQGMLQADARLL